MEQGLEICNGGECNKQNARCIEDNQLVIFDMKNISRGCVVRR